MSCFFFVDVFTFQWLAIPIWGKTPGGLGGFDESPWPMASSVLFRSSLKSLTTSWRHWKILQIFSKGREWDSPHWPCWWGWGMGMWKKIEVFYNKSWRKSFVGFHASFWMVFGWSMDRGHRNLQWINSLGETPKFVSLTLGFVLNFEGWAMKQLKHFTCRGGIF